MNSYRAFQLLQESFSIEDGKGNDNKVNRKNMRTERVARTLEEFRSIFCKATKRNLHICSLDDNLKIQQ